ncbi:L,D-transpeptidase family protein [Leptospira levettii]|uniref:L,D-transpeptidase family protein n=1 Tax=Leptospira levettii TaxID=2023178 RepID=UPI00223E2045|nr:L,D-transpeptidase family protein [Leptospira levettii]
MPRFNVFPEGNPTDLTFPPKFFQTEQVILIVGRPGETKGKLYVFTLVEGEWKTDFEEVPVWFGRSGLTLSNRKREGDGFTPEGYFPIKRILGKRKKTIRQLEYTQIRKFHFWNDDPNSKHYNQLVSKKEKGVHSLWDSDIYELFVVIEHNTNPSLPGMGSMIFLHPWSETKPTSGCVGVNRDTLFKIVDSLDGNKNPFLIISFSSEN